MLPWFEGAPVYFDTSQCNCNMAIVKVVKKTRALLMSTTNNNCTTMPRNYETFLVPFHAKVKILFGDL